MQLRALILTIAAVTAFSTLSWIGMPRASAADSPAAGSGSASKKEVRAGNRALSHAVRQSLTRVKGLDSSRITVLARGTTITLQGSAPDQSQIESAAGAAAQVSGVKRVDNRLTITEAGH
jgi:osmotically-inducible protein OsmY